MNIIDAIILGILQGITEFLPVSSSGHLVVAQHFLKYQPDEHLLFDVILHLGTLVAVVLVYRHSLGNYIRSSIQMLKKSERSMWERASEDVFMREIFWILVATVPTGLIGIFFRKEFKKIFSSLPSVGVLFAFTGCLLLVTYWRSGGERPISELGWWRALLIGVAQGVAIAPGISRSGMTIAMALLIGMRRDDAARYSFLLSIPAISGAALLELRKVQWAHMPYVSLLIGGIAAAVTGYLALIFLLRLVRKGQLAWFAPYLWVLAAAILYKSFAG